MFFDVTLGRLTQENPVSAKKKEMFLHKFLVYIIITQNVSKKDFSIQLEKEKICHILTQ